MKIAFINDQPPFSGMGKYAYYLFQHFKKYPNFYFIFLDYNSRTVIEYNQNQKKVIFQSYLIPFLDNKPLFWLRIKNKLPFYDIYHFANQNLSFMVNKNFSIVTCHDIAPLFCPTNFFELNLRKYLYSGLKLANLIIADSNNTKIDLIKRYNIRENKIKVIYLGVDHNIYYPQNDKELLRKKWNLPIDGKILIHPGAEKWRKNVFNIIKALKILEKRLKNIYLIRVGKKTKKIEKLIDKLDLKKIVIYYQNLKEEELAELYNASDLLVFPSFYEGFGLPVLEAMACGLPTIISNLSSLPEITMNNSFYCNPFSYEDIAEKIYKILTDKELYNYFKIKGLNYIKTFSWEKCANEVWKIYEEIINR
ncbi:MAG: glycosyltransferase family 4 protein [candidate division WOR-3 bacterium]|nr:glycosyltransferase family 4 protein [candidate division WOR-3 bacterium]